MIQTKDPERALIERAQAVTGLSQEQLAAEIGVAHSTLKSWITAGGSRRGMPGPARVLLERIAGRV